MKVYVILTGEDYGGSTLVDVYKDKSEADKRVQELKDDPNEYYQYVDNVEMELK